ncbi:YtpR family tRNA-binding protein [Lapidilactobacillus bayanensis]|uniref:YtpR family tRNA-binding protein n=1 Tax=Lapidilactobacillus bayanensis TaxID=2485998 RepID=UPI000F78EAF8
MLISSYNPTALGDVLIMVTGQATNAEQNVVSQGDVTCIIRKDRDELVGVNLFNASQHVHELTVNGQIFLSEEQIAEVNAALQQAGFDFVVSFDNQPKFVVGHVETLVEHPDSDHLHIAQVDLGTEQQQIVCGAPNIGAGQKVVVARIGAMMPDGKIIWPGKLRGVASYGMICSAHELGLPNAPQRHGILVLDAATETGAAFDFAGDYSANY